MASWPDARGKGEPEKQAGSEAAQSKAGNSAQEKVKHQRTGERAKRRRCTEWGTEGQNRETSTCADQDASVSSSRLMSPW